MNIYAPIVIPTLNRYEHFVRCLESLEKCTDSEKTDVYIGLDYPPSNKYVDGWKLIFSYLDEKVKKNNFRNLYVRRRTENCGVGHKNSNSSLLIQEVSSISDRYVLIEDDTELSPNFIVYMNQGLEKYKNDSRIIKITAYTPSIFNGVSPNNIFCGIDVGAYGIGSWVEKNKLIIRGYENIEAELKKSIFRTWRFFMMYPSIIYSAVRMIEMKKNWGDVTCTINNMINGTYAILPSLSMSRCWGADGTGVNKSNILGLEKEEIQDSNNFEMDDIPIDINRKYRKSLFFRNMPKNYFRFFMALVYEFFYVTIFCLRKKSSR